MNTGTISTETVLHALHENNSALSAEQIARILTNDSQQSDHSTVSTIIEQLVEEGRIHRTKKNFYTSKKILDNHVTSYQIKHDANTGKFTLISPDQPANQNQPIIIPTNSPKVLTHLNERPDALVDAHLTINQDGSYTANITAAYNGQTRKNIPLTKPVPKRNTTKKKQYVSTHPDIATLLEIKQQTDDFTTTRAINEFNDIIQSKKDERSTLTHITNAVKRMRQTFPDSPEYNDLIIALENTATQKIIIGESERTSQARKDYLKAIHNLLAWEKERNKQQLIENIGDIFDELSLQDTLTALYDPTSINKIANQFGLEPSRHKEEVYVLHAFLEAAVQNGSFNKSSVGRSYSKNTGPRLPKNLDNLTLKIEKTGKSTAYYLEQIDLPSGEIQPTIALKSRTLEAEKAAKNPNIRFGASIKYNGNGEYIAQIKQAYDATTQQEIALALNPKTNVKIAKKAAHIKRQANLNPTYSAGNPYTEQHVLQNIQALDMPFHINKLQEIYGIAKTQTAKDDNAQDTIAREYLRETVTNLVLTGQLYQKSPKYFSADPIIPLHYMHVQLKQDDGEFSVVNPLWQNQYTAQHPAVTITDSPEKLSSLANNGNIYVDVQLTPQEGGSYTGKILNAYNTATLEDLSAPFRDQTKRVRELDPDGKRAKKAARREERYISGMRKREEYHAAKAEAAAEQNRLEDERIDQINAEYAQKREKTLEKAAKEEARTYTDSLGMKFYRSAYPPLTELLEKSPLQLEFSNSALGETKNLSVPQPAHDSTHQNLTDIELITIDPVTARDFDDAVFAVPDNTADSTGKLTNENGMKIVVAIADVAHYVRYLNKDGQPSALNKEALGIGNSTYPPKRVIPMLPETLSNDLCSLRPMEERAAMVMMMRIDQDGQLIDKQLKRGIIKSRARLTYQQAQDAYDGQLDTTTEPLTQHIDNLYTAYHALKTARDQRKSLELEANEPHIQKDFKDNSTVLTKGERIDSQKLIEEFMILANVAAAQLADACVYRVHAPPPKESVERGLKDLGKLGVMDLPAADDIQTQEDINALRDLAAGQVDNQSLASIIIRMQAKAEYATDNIGHFGLNLSEYGHFTSPIRRYSDLLLHRLLIDQLNLGEDGLHPSERENLAQMCIDISLSERRSDMIERIEKQQIILEKLVSQQNTPLEAQIVSLGPYSAWIKIQGGLNTNLAYSQISQSKSPFTHSEDGETIYNSETGECYTIGDVLELEIHDINMDTLNFELTVTGRKSPSNTPSLIPTNE